MKTLVAGVIAAMLVAAPAFAQYNPGFAPTQRSSSPYEAYGAVTPFGSPTTGPTGGVHMNAAREAAMRECNGEASKYKEYTWGNMDISAVPILHGTARPSRVMLASGRAGREKRLLNKDRGGDGPSRNATAIDRR